MAVKQVGANKKPSEGRTIWDANDLELEGRLNTHAGQIDTLGTRVSGVEGGTVANAGGVLSFAGGPLASRPVAGVPDRRYLATDTGGRYRDTGTTWALESISRWEDLLNKPTSFSPAPHGHLIGDLPVASGGVFDPAKLVRSDDVRLSNPRTPLDSTVTDAKVAAGSHLPTTVASAAALPATARVGKLFYLDDVNEYRKNDGTEAAPVWNALGGSSGPGISIAEFAHLAAGSNWTAAWDAAIQKLKDQALPGSIAGNSWQRLGMLRMPKGYYEISPDRLLENMRGLKVVGEGAEATIVKIPSAGTLWDLHHDAQIEFSDMTIDGYTTHVYSADGTTHQVPRENTRAFRIRQKSGDAFPGWGSVGFYFKRVVFKGLHASIQYADDIQCDMVHYEDCRWLDCFNVFEYRNRNSVNHTISGNWEIQCFQGASRQAMFNEALSSWAAFQPFHPASPTIFDGAICQFRDGGAVSFTGEGGIIVPYAWVLFESASGFYGTITGLDKREFFDFQNIRVEQNHTDVKVDAAGVRTGGDQWGQNRTALIRRNNPEFTTAWARNTVRIRGCQLGSPSDTNAPRELLYLYNGMDLVFENSHANWGDGGTGGGNALVSYVNFGTPSAPGRYRGRNEMRFGNFKHIRRTTDGVGVAVDHNVSGEHFRTTARNQRRERGRAEWRSDAGLLPGTGGVAATAQIPIPVGARLVRGGIVRFSGGATTEPNLAFVFERSDGAVAYGSATLVFSTTGQNFKPFIDNVEGVTGADGVVQIRVPTVTATQIFGYVWVEYV